MDGQLIVSLYTVCPPLIHQGHYEIAVSSPRYTTLEVEGTASFLCGM